MNYLNYDLTLLNMKLSLTYILIIYSFYFNAQIPTNGLVGHYPFTGNANDMSLNNYHGTVYGASLTSDRFGNLNCAYSFNGINNYIDLSSHVASFNFQEPMTISFWVKTDYDNSGSTNFAATVFAISEGGTGLNNTSIFVGNNATGTLTNEIALTNQQRNTSDKYIAGYTTSNRSELIDNKWHHLVFEYNGVSTKIYLDGELVTVSCNFGVNNGTYGNIPNASKMYIGSRWANSNLAAFMNGELDDFRMYNRVLNLTEINSLFNEANPSLTTAEISNSKDYEIKVYPNPTTDKVYILWTNDIDSDINIEIYDNMGKMIDSESISYGLGNFSVNLKDFKSGIYYIRFISKDFKKIYEIIKQ